MKYKEHIKAGLIAGFTFLFISLFLPIQYVFEKDAVIIEKEYYDCKEGFFSNKRIDGKQCYETTVILKEPFRTYVIQQRIIGTITFFILGMALMFDNKEIKENKKHKNKEVLE